MREFHEQLLITQAPIHYVSTHSIHEQSSCPTFSTKQSPHPTFSTLIILLVQHCSSQAFFILQLKNSPRPTFSTSNIVLLPTFSFYEHSRHWTFSFSNILLVEHSHHATFYSSKILLILQHSLPRIFSNSNICLPQRLDREKTNKCVGGIWTLHL